jgi:hypothetical protein
LNDASDVIRLLVSQGAIVCLFLLAQVIASAEISAQNLPDSLLPRPGERVRLHRALLPAIVGRLTAIDETGLMVDGRGEFSDSIVVLVSDISRLDVSRGRSGWAGAIRGLGLGLVGGAALGAITLATMPDPTNCDWFCKRSERAVIGALLGGMYGSPTGFVIGAVVGVERWSIRWRR